jgi:preprotein translocase subunit SecG
MKNLIYIFLLLFISFIIIFFYMNTNNTKSENIKTDFKEENLKEAYFA